MNFIIGDSPDSLLSDDSNKSKGKKKSGEKIKGLKIDTASAGGNCGKSKIQMGQGMNTNVNLNGSAVNIARNEVEC